MIRGLTKKEERSYRSKINNAAGKNFESLLNFSCKMYSEKNIAKIEKIPEPFKVLKKKGRGVFEGVFTSNAEPDFQGCYRDGGSIVFECKYTSTERFCLNVLTEQQLKSLQEYSNLGAYTFIAIGIQEKYFFVPFCWITTQTKKSFSQKDLKKFEIKQIGRYLDFLKQME